MTRWVRRGVLWLLVLGSLVGLLAEAAVSIRGVGDTPVGFTVAREVQLALGAIGVLGLLITWGAMMDHHPRLARAAGMVAVAAWSVWIAIAAGS